MNTYEVIRAMMAGRRLFCGKNGWYLYGGSGFLRQAIMEETAFELTACGLILLHDAEYGEYTLTQEGKDYYRSVRLQMPQLLPYLLMLIFSLVLLALVFLFMRITRPEGPATTAPSPAGIPTRPAGEALAPV